MDFVNDLNNKLSMIGRLFGADFGEKDFTLLIENANKLILTEVKGPEVGRIQQLPVNIAELRPNLFIVNWQEETFTVTDLEDYEQALYMPTCNTK